jgi:uncharacterized protein (TIGR02246 family)
MKRQVILLIIVTLVFCFYAVPSAIAASDEEEIIQVQTNFMKAYAAKDFKAMASLYLHSSKTSTFNPGNQPLLCEGWEESLKNRWENTMASETDDVTAYFHHPKVTMIKDDVAVITGYESVTYTNPTTKEATVNHNRVTRVVQKIEGKWLIVHDHVDTFSIE